MGAESRMDSKHIFSVNQRVKLKSQGEDSVYEKAMAGSVGTIRSLDFDNVDFPMVYIEWDKNHWAYNGEGDMWTYENHFEEDRDQMNDNSGRDEQDPSGDSNFVEFLAQKLGVSVEEAELDFHDQVNGLGREEDKSYSDNLMDAFDACDGAEAFIAISVNKNQINGLDVMTPSVYSGSVNVEANLLAQAFMSSLGSVAHENAIIALIKLKNGL